jgi:hypothetical protein
MKTQHLMTLIFVGLGACNLALGFRWANDWRGGWFAILPIGQIFLGLGWLYLAASAALYKEETNA